MAFPDEEGGIPDADRYTIGSPREPITIPSLSQEPLLVTSGPLYPKPLPRSAISRPVDADLAQSSTREVSNELRSAVDRATPHESDGL
jgi:hypothetical protein